MFDYTCQYSNNPFTDMLANLFVKLCKFSPAFKKFLWQQWYQYLAWYYRKRDWTFMNYGYAMPTPLALRQEHEADRYSIQLYHYVAEPGSLAGKKIVEVGCGRGGGANYIHRAFKSQSTIGVDFSAQAVKFCNATYKESGLTFVKGDAEALPLMDNSVDAVVNVESSHCYGNMAQFLKEVHRVLTPGGYFLFADLREKEELNLLDRQIERSNLVLIQKEDITAGVLNSIDLDNNRKSEFIQRLVPGRLLQAFREFAGVSNSKIDRLLRSGEIKYQRFVLQKLGST